MHHSKAIVLSSRNFRENDKIVNFYTKDFGKKEILVAGARKIISKLNPHIQYFALLEISFAEGRNLDRLTSAVLKEDYPRIKSFLSRPINSGKFCLEMVSQLTKPFHPDKKIFNLLKDLFKLLNHNLEISQFKLLIPAFLIKFLSFLGYRPELYFCLSCKNKIREEGNFFSFKKGGLVCAKCHKKNDLAQTISTDSIKILRLFVSENLDVIKKIKAGKIFFDELDKITINFLFFHSDLPATILKSLNNDKILPSSK